MKKVYILGNPIFKIGNNRGIGSTHDKNQSLDLFHYQGSKIVTQNIFLYLNVSFISVCNGYNSDTLGNLPATMDIHCQAISMPTTCQGSLTLHSRTFLYVAIMLF